MTLEKETREEIGRYVSMAIHELKKAYPGKRVTLRVEACPNQNSTILGDTEVSVSAIVVGQEKGGAMVDAFSFMHL